MGAFSRAALARLPLAEAVMHCWDWALHPEALQEIFEQHRGRSYEKVLTFATMVRLVGSALVEHGGSGNQAFIRAAEADELGVSKEAVYRKLRDLPLDLSAGFLRASTRRIERLLPRNILKATHLPPSLRHMEVMFVDGKKIKQVPRMLMAARGTTVAVLGGKTLSALSWNTGLVIASQAHLDGETSDAPLVPELLVQLAESADGRERLFVEDRQFSDLTHPQILIAEEYHFLIRFNRKVKFHRDEKVKPVHGKDAEGHAIVQEWGWIGAPSDPRRLRIRYITLERPVTPENLKGEPLILFTDLLNAEEFPVGDLLETYRNRWGIERVFQKITEVLHLDNLISTTPEGTVFQFDFCMLLYNIIQLMTQYLAESQHLEADKISQEKLFYDVHKQLSALNTIAPSEEIVADWRRLETVGAVRQRLKTLLASAWTERWLKAKKKKRTTPHKGAVLISGTHTSMYRLICNKELRGREKVARE
jgi:hypothetical protein